MSFAPFINSEVKNMKKKKFAKLREWNRRRNYFMKNLRMNIARLLFDRKKPTAFVLSDIKRVLFLRDDDKIGDMVVSTSLFREFGRAGFIIDVLAGKNNISVIESNPWINQKFIAPENNKKRFLLAKKLATNPYDLVIDMGDKISPAHLYFLKLLKAKNVIGFNKSDYNIYNKSINFSGYDQHITARYNLLMESLNFKYFSTDYDLHSTVEIQSLVTDFVSSLPGNRKFVINPFAADPRRDMSDTQLAALVSKLQIEYPDSDIIFIGIPSRIKKLTYPGTYLNPFTGLASAVEMIRHADLVISPDTSIVHIAAAWKKPMVCLYGNDIHGKFINSAVWGPGYPQAIPLSTKDKFHPVSTISVDEIFSAIKSLL